MEKFMAFKFPAPAILDFMTARWKFESNKLFHLLLLLNVISSLSCKIWKLGIISNNLTSTRPKSGGSL